MSAGQREISRSVQAVKRRRRAAFTLIEVLVTIVLVLVAVVGSLQAIRAIGQAEVKAREAELLQRLAADKWNEMGAVTDPQTAETNGDFTDQGYPDVEWELTVEPSGTTNVDQLTITATRGQSSQTLTGLLFVRPTTGGAAGGSTP
jgi:prepilin-type N-terminal cleavage/methylation domain-containing protein